MIGVVGYRIASERLADNQQNAYEAIQKTDVQSIEEAGARGITAGNVEQEIRNALRAVAIRPTVVRADVIGPEGSIVAAQNRRAIGQQRGMNPDVKEVLDSGKTVLLRGDSPDDMPGYFFAYSPVQIGSQRYALETAYDRSVFDDRLASVRLTLLVTSALTLLIGGLVFYLVGGRSLVRSHKFALKRANLDGLTGLFN